MYREFVNSVILFMKRKVDLAVEILKKIEI